MAKKYRYGHHFLREWRKSRSLTLEKLAELTDTTHATLSRIERRLQPLGQPLVDALATVLKTSRGAIFDELPAAKTELRVLHPAKAPKIGVN